MNIVNQQINLYISKTIVNLISQYSLLLTTVKWARLSAGEVSLVRGCLQVLVFSLVTILTHKTGGEGGGLEGGNKQGVEATLLKEDTDKISKSSRSLIIKNWCLACLRGFLTASSSFSCVMAVGLMPIGDLIVLAFISPVFSVILDAIILKRPLTFLSVILCILIGDITISQCFQRSDQYCAHF